MDEVVDLLKKILYKLNDIEDELSEINSSVNGIYDLDDIYNAIKEITDNGVNTLGDVCSSIDLHD